jgi:hypothetical protein
MSATLLSTVGNFGVAADETGMIIESVSQESRSEMAYTRTRQGARQGLSCYDESVLLRHRGLMASTAGFSSKLAAALTLANAAATTHINATSTGKTVLMSVSRERLIEGFETLEIASEFLPAF